MSNTQIHPTAVIASGAQLGNDVSVGPFAVVEDDVIIADGCQIGPHTLIASGARLATGVKVHNGAVLATVPQDLKFEGEKTLLEVGENTVIREFATLNRGTHHRGKTSVGANCLLMAYSHVAHDCVIGDHVIMANSVNLAGHVVIDEWAIIGGLVPVHQFVRIGAHVMIGGGFRVPMDIVPYAIMAGAPLKVMGINRIGLERRGFSKESIEALEKAFRILFRSRLNTSQAVAKLKSEMEPTPEIQRILTFIEQSERGVNR